MSKTALKPRLRSLLAIAKIGRKQAIALAAATAFFGIYAVSKGGESGDRKLVSEREGEFKRSRMLGDPYAPVARAKERRLDKSARDYTDAQKTFGEQLTRIDGHLAELDGRVASLSPKPGQNQAPSVSPQAAPSGVSPVAPTRAEGGEATPPVASGATGTSTPVDMSKVPSAAGPRQPLDIRPMLGDRPLRPGRGLTSPRPIDDPRGPAVISFPVKADENRERTEIVLPPGAYVKGKMLTGVEAPEGTPYPVLIQLDFANILPNHKTLDLSGCFVIVKAEGNLSIERVKMQATKLSCVARDGKMFERDINGFVVDAVDNSFAVMGSVNSKQDRVAAMAFLSSVVEGAGRAIQMAQTSEQTSADGTSRRLLTGDQGKYIGAGGISQAGSMVAQWYLKQAQGLLPTINVGSGKDVWIVMHESVSLPQTYFKKVMGDSFGKDYSFISRLLDQ